MTAPVWRGERRLLPAPASRDQEHAVLLVVERGRHRAGAASTRSRSTRTGATTLDAWQPSLGGRPAGVRRVDRRHRGVARCASWTSRPASGGRADRPGPATPPSPGCPAARSSSTCATWRRATRRRGRSCTAGCTCTGSAPTRTPTRWSSATGADAATYYGVGISRDGRWLAVIETPRHRPAQRPVARRPHRRRARLRPPSCSAASTRDAYRHRPRRPAVLWTDRDAPRGRLCVGRPADDRRPDLARRSSPRTPRRCSTTSPSSTGRSWTPARWSAGPARASAS